MPRRFRIIVAALAAAAVSGPVFAAPSDAPAKKPAAAHAAKPVATGTQSPHSTATADPHAKKGAVETEGSKRTGAPDPHAEKKTAADAPAAKTATRTADPHAPLKAPSPEAPAPVHARKASATAQEPRLPLATDLHALKDRIQERLAEVRRTQTAKSSPGGKAAAAHREPAPARRAAAPRVELVWRPSVTWPQELRGSEAAAVAQPPLASSRIPVAWGPQP